MRVLVIGKGGREHALCWALAKSQDVEIVFAAPGNAGTQSLEKCENFPEEDPSSWIAFAKAQKVDVAVIGPEEPLSKGVADAFGDAGVFVVGPSRKAAEIESSKVFSKKLMESCHIPTARAQVFTDPRAAEAFVRQERTPIVIKADGLCGGKGVVVAQNIDEAQEAIDRFMVKKIFGDAGSRILVEECLHGVEASVMAYVGEKNMIFLPPAKDYKRLLEGDLGPNTGGMGAISPHPHVDNQLLDEIQKKVFTPAVAEMASRSSPFRGFLYAGVMIDEKRYPWVLEFNARLGDPETQAVLPRLLSDLSLWFSSQEMPKPIWDEQVAVAIVLATAGYPQTSSSVLLRLPSMPEGAYIFLGASRITREGIVSQGGRVATVVALGENFSLAREKALALAEEVDFEGKIFRRDIGNTQEMPVQSTPWGEAR
mgnify:CR=1 FL=1